MKITEKLVETKEKVKNWCEEHRQGIRDFGWYTTGAIVCGVTAYITGKSYGVEEGKKLEAKRIFGGFEPDDNG